VLQDSYGVKTTGDQDADPIDTSSQFLDCGPEGTLDGYGRLRPLFRGSNAIDATPQARRDEFT
jgi:hypothetical protein